MESSYLSDWQNPFVDVFKRYNVFQTLQDAMKGNVTVNQEPGIARKCVKLVGNTPSNSTLTIPNPSGSIKHCDLTGRYLYVEILATPDKYFTIHVDVAIKEREPGVRLTITNMQKEYAVSGGNTLKIPFHVDRTLWTILCIDLEDHLENKGLFPKGAVKSFRDAHIIKSIELCANATIRGVYTSPNVYDWQSLPKEMSFTLVKGGRWSDKYNFIYLPPAISPQETRKRLKKEEASQLQQNISKGEPEVRRKTQKPSLPSPIVPNANSLLQQDITPMPEEPFVQLNCTLAFSPIHNPDILLKDNSVIYSSGSLVVLKSLQTGQQTFLQGHTDYICAMDCVDNWIVTVQKGAKPIVRVWVDGKCVNSFLAPQDKVQQLRMNNKKHVALVAADVYNRQVITILDISEAETKKRATMLARQVSDFNILTLKFSPVEPDKLISCGRQNIRFWRINNEHLPGAPVILNHHARNTIFTVFDFEYAYDDPNPVLQKQKIKNVYVGSQNGLLLQVNYHTHKLEEVYKLHDSAICSIMLSVGFCITGGEDQVLRVWPLDFTDFILEAEHQGIITSLALSDDGMHVACGTSSGGLGILDLSNHSYKTILRSHTDRVIQAVYHEYSNSIITLSNDLTIRLWDPEKLQQTYEFLYPKEDPCTCISGNPLSMHFAAGFKSGMLRTFDIQKTCINQELRQHQESIQQIVYSPDGKFLCVVEKKLVMLYSPLHGHQAIKHLPVEMPSKFQSCSFSPDSTQLAVIGDSGTHINLWELKTLQMIGKVFTSKVVRMVKFSPDGNLWTTFEDAGIRRYNINNMTIEAEGQALHRGAVSDIDFDLTSHLLFSVGQDSLLKVWDYSFQREPHQVHIGHVGAIGGVLVKHGRVWTIGSEGVFQWNLKEGPKYDPPFIRTRTANFIKNNIKEEKPVVLASHVSHQDESLANLSVGQIRETKPVEGPVMFSQKLKKKENDELVVAGEQKFAPQRLDMTFLKKTLDYKKSKKKQARARIVNICPEVNEKYHLPQRHFYIQELERGQKDYQLKIDLIKQNKSNFKIRFLTGLEAYTHDNVVWNYVFGWYAYTLDNLIIVETLGKERTQKIIPLPQKLTSIQLTRDMKRLIAVSAYNSTKKQKGLADSSSEQDSQISADSSEAETADVGLANIFILSRQFEVQKKLSFHTRGIQALCLSENGKYLVTIGNFRECTVCVWQLTTGKLKASSFTLDKLNDVKCMDWASEGRNLEFATVGRDQIHFWALDRDDRLEYYDVFIPKGEDGELPEITACEYVYLGQAPKLLIGLANGYIMAVEYGTFETVLSRVLTNGPIMGIYNVGHKVCVTSTDGNIYFWSYESVLKDITMPNFAKINLQYCVNSLALDPQAEEGLVGTTEGIYYANLKEQYSSMLVGTFNSPILFTRVVANYFVTSHLNGRLKLWNLETGEEIRTYKWKSMCREVYYDESSNKLVCFLDNGNQIKLVNLNKFTRDQIYTHDETIKPEVKSEDYAIRALNVAIGGRPTKWVFMRKGEVYGFELVQEGRKKIMKLEKVLELNQIVQSVQVYSQKNMVFVITKDGLICSYAADLSDMDKYTLTIMDKVSLAQVIADAKAKEIPVVPISASIQLAASRTINQTYFAICDKLPYVYFRNYMKRVTLHKISLSSLPKCIIAYEWKKQSEILIGLLDGGIEVISTMEPENRYKVESIVNGPVDGIVGVRSKQTLILSHPNAIALYAL